MTCFDNSNETWSIKYTSRFQPRRPAMVYILWNLLCRNRPLYHGKHDVYSQLIIILTAVGFNSLTTVILSSFAFTRAKELLPLSHAIVYVDEGLLHEIDQYPPP